MQASPGDSSATPGPPLIVDRYAIYDAIAAGGMATVHLGRLIGPSGFSRTVAIKRLHPHYAADPEFTAMFLDEARMAARVHHPNVVPTLDVLQSQNELLLVMEYVRGDSLSKLLRSSVQAQMAIPPRIAVAIVSGALQGLHAAHEATSEHGQPLGLVHRDMSPQNIIVGIDGTARVLDFGVAKAEGRMQHTADGQVKGKLMYMPPEQLSAGHVTRTADLYSMGVVLFEVLTGKRMFAGENDAAAMGRILRNQIHVPSEFDPRLAAFDAIVRHSTALDPTRRFATAREMSLALERCVQPASASEVGAWVEHFARNMLHTRAKRVAEIESSTSQLSGQLSGQLGGQLGGQMAANSSGFMGAQPPLALSSQSAVGAVDGSGILITPHAPAPAKSRLAIALGALLLIAFGVIAFLVGARSSNQGNAPSANLPSTAMASKAGAAGQQAASALAVANAADAPSAAAEPAQPVAAAPVTAIETAKTAAATIVAPAMNASAKQGRASGGAGVGTAARASTTKQNCVPPYTIDANGHRHFKAECIQ